MPTTKKKTSPPAKPASPPVHSAPLAPTGATIDVNRAPEAGQALALQKQALRMVVKDRASHAAALEFARGAKQLQRKITEHWQRITRGIDDLKRKMLDLKAKDLEPVEAAIKIVEGIALDYENAEKERVRLAEETQRREREQKALAERNRELEAAEDKALEIEQQSANLSARELWFVTQVFEQGLSAHAPTARELTAMTAIAKQAGYKDVDNQVARLLRAPKILEAIKGKQDAKAIREQAAARREQPIDIIDAPPVESNIARGHGLPTTRTYYSCAVDDVNKLKEAFLNGEVDSQCLTFDQVYLNTQARAAKSAEIFERAFPGCRLVKRQGLAG